MTQKVNKLLTQFSKLTEEQETRQKKAIEEEYAKQRKKLIGTGDINNRPIKKLKPNAPDNRVIDWNLFNPYGASTEDLGITPCPDITEVIHINKFTSKVEKKEDDDIPIVNFGKQEEDDDQKFAKPQSKQKIKQHEGNEKSLIKSPLPTIKRVSTPTSNGNPISKTLTSLTNNQQFIDRFKPSRSIDIVGKQNGYTNFTDWLAVKKHYQFKKFCETYGSTVDIPVIPLENRFHNIAKSFIKSVAFIFGPIGSGKTMMVNIALKEMGYTNIRELNFASLIENGEPGSTLSISIRRIACTTNIKYDSEGKIAPLLSALIIEDIDGLFSTIKFIEENKKKLDYIDWNNLKSFLNTLPLHMAPIIIICSDRSQKKVREIENLCEKIRWFPPWEKELRTICGRILLQCKTNLPDSTIQQLITDSGRDVRRLIFSLEMLIKLKQSSGKSYIQQYQFLDAIRSDIFGSNFAKIASLLLSTKKDFKLKKPRQTDLDLEKSCYIYESDPILMKEFIFENYPSCFELNGKRKRFFFFSPPHTSFKKKDSSKECEILNRLSQVADDISFSDTISHWNENFANPSVNAFVSYTCHLHKNLTNFTHNAENTEKKLRFPELRKNFQESKTMQSNTRSLLKKLPKPLSVQISILDLYYRLDLIRNRLESFDKWTQNDKKLFIQTLKTCKFTQNELRQVLQRDHFILLSPTISISLGNKSRYIDLQKVGELSLYTNLCPF